LSDPIKEATFTLLPTARQNGQEQAALVLGALRHEPAAQRLLPLLKAPRAQTRRAASWALRCLAAPSTADAILQHLQVETGKLHGLRSDEIDIEVCADLEHLIEALGVMKHRPATALLMKYLPPPPPVIPPELEGSKPVWLPHLRSAAIWSLGQIHATTPGKEVISGLQSRLRSADVTTVRTMAAVGLGRMHTKSASKELRNLLDDSFEEIEVRRASAWALEQIEGQSSEMPAYPDMAMERWYTGWFLEPTTAVPKKR
jgi:HEAT repeat protein